MCRMSMRIFIRYCGCGITIYEYQKKHYSEWSTHSRGKKHNTTCGKYNIQFRRREYLENQFLFFLSRPFHFFPMAHQMLCGFCGKKKNFCSTNMSCTFISLNEVYRHTHTYPSYTTTPLPFFVVFSFNGKRMFFFLIYEEDLKRI